MSGCRSKPKNVLLPLSTQRPLRFHPRQTLQVDRSHQASREQIHLVRSRKPQGPHVLPGFLESFGEPSLRPRRKSLQNLLSRLPPLVLPKERPLLEPPPLRIPFAPVPS